MALNIAATQILSQPVSAFFEGRAIQRAEQDTALRQAQQAKAEARAQGDYEINQKLANAKLDANQAQKAYSAASEVLKQPEGKRLAFAKENYSEFMTEYSKRYGGEPDEAHVTQLATGLQSHAKSQLGIIDKAESPQGQLATDAQNGFLSKDQADALIKPKPDYTLLLEQGRNDRAAAALAAKAAATKANTMMNPDPAAVEAKANAIAKYQSGPLSGYTERTPFGTEVTKRLYEINPKYQANEFGARSKAYKDFATGKQGNAVRSFVVTDSHLGTLQELGEALQNKDTQVINRVANRVAQETGSAAPTNFDAAKRIVADEVVKAIVGGQTALGDREEAAATIMSASSPAQLSGVIATYRKLVGGQMAGLKNQFESSTGRDDFADEFKLSPQLTSYMSANASSSQLPQVKTQADWAALKSNTQYLDPSGKLRTKK